MYVISLYGSKVYISVLTMRLRFAGAAMSSSCLLVTLMMLTVILVSTALSGTENQAVVSYVQSAGADSRVASDYLILPVGMFRRERSESRWE
jgi:hypothetical protein